ncbi:MAG TPA: AsmA-like C-terminal region-containing protein [Fibrobacteraceae bacterium]|nr:AsmA-like C-terminal region-containing protein [Fibrobacteraceae bacterium]
MATMVLPKEARWEGEAQGQLHWKGRIAHPQSWQGEGKAKLEEVQFKRWPFQVEGTFARFMPQLKESLQLDKVEIPSFLLAKGKVHVDSLTAKGKDITVQGKGVWTFPQRLDFRLKGEISGELYKDLPKLARMALPQTEDGSGRFSASFAGTFSWQAIIPDSEHYGTVLRNLFR